MEIDGLSFNWGLVRFLRTTRWPLARVGGEEFGVLLTDIDTERAKALAERIRENVERLTGDNPEYAIPQKVTISIGAVVTQENTLNPNEIYRLADNALYEAKENGRNKVVVRDVVNFCESPWSGILAGDFGKR